MLRVDAASTVSQRRRRVLEEEDSAMMAGTRAADAEVRAASLLLAAGSARRRGNADRGASLATAMGALGDSDARVRSQAAAAVAQLVASSQGAASGHCAAAAVAIGRLLKDSDAHVRRSAVRALGIVVATAAASRGAAGNTSGSSAGMTAVAGDLRRVAQLDEDVEVRFQALRALAATGGPGVRDAAEGCLKDSSAKVRLAAVAVLSRSNEATTARTVAELRAMARVDTDSAVRELAEAAAARLEAAADPAAAAAAALAAAGSAAGVGGTCQRRPPPSSRPETAQLVAAAPGSPTSVGAGSGSSKAVPATYLLTPRLAESAAQEAGGQQGSSSIEEQFNALSPRQHRPQPHFADATTTLARASDASFGNESKMAAEILVLQRENAVRQTMTRALVFEKDAAHEEMEAMKRENAALKAVLRRLSKDPGKALQETPKPMGATA
eukprot:gnl/TRDRNA2_/TRDRNA2_53862_c0_seq1.p1 gnl/TRDRNA2_/TRDRNA2_53862_c0~~gnl/TRDRNA2_/TRDRNA2_53862_c0_seq1.p1  ORF type:complete len:441 (+),score=113.67 gnl/TRDRNA2_/TRDRNA2_53862_c0_seq1:44-1366(+)